MILSEMNAATIGRYCRDWMFGGEPKSMVGLLAAGEQGGASTSSRSSQVDMDVKQLRSLHLQILSTRLQYVSSSRIALSNHC